MQGPHRPSPGSDVVTRIRTVTAPSALHSTAAPVCCGPDVHRINLPQVVAIELSADGVVGLALADRQSR
eukprot:scaffold422397_cov50-Prasinocladus_malaysianus.AAC.1